MLPFAQRANRRAVGPVDLVTLASPVTSVVSFRGSIRTNPDFASGDDLRQDLLVALLDKGTQRRDRFALAELLDDRGTQVQFFSDGLRVGFSGKALRGEVAGVLGLVAEMLREPLFDADEFDKARQMEAAGFQRALENTGSQAAGAFARRLYGTAHPNYAPNEADELARLGALELGDIRAYYDAHLGSDALTLALVGDIPEAEVEAALAEHFGGWAAANPARVYATSAEAAAPGRADVAMPGKQNLDAFLGHPLALRRDAPDYFALYLALFALGGNFSARLMNTIRDEQGLTYGIGAGLAGLSTEYDGHFRIRATFSQQDLERGLEATRAEFERFVDGGITADELRTQQTTLAGAFQVGLATTGGLAAALLATLQRGDTPDYLDRYVDLIEAVDVDAANAAIGKYLRPEALHIVTAGEQA